MKTIILELDEATAKTVGGLLNSILEEMENKLAVELPAARLESQFQIDMEAIKGNLKPSAKQRLMNVIIGDPVKEHKRFLEDYDKLVTDANILHDQVVSVMMQIKTQVVLQFDTAPEK
jgi:hypothetical protein